MIYSVHIRNNPGGISLKRWQSYTHGLRSGAPRNLQSAANAILPINTIWYCLGKISEVMRPRGSFYATFFRGPDAADRFRFMREPVLEGRVAVHTFADENPYHYSADDFRRMCSIIPLSFEDIGEWGHPRHQQMIAFTRT